MAKQTATDEEVRGLEQRILELERTLNSWSLRVEPEAQPADISAGEARAEDASGVVTTGESPQNAELVNDIAKAADVPLEQAEKVLQAAADKHRDKALKEAKEVFNEAAVAERSGPLPSPLGPPRRTREDRPAEAGPREQP
jgi:hypothetical protein